ncbi:TldD protein [Enterococcus sp. 7F3_DIV0205]|uniref:TldD protein n=1 Tax=Candidatus Enterococcus palustris TaxID=1834189 RepID=A0AAQ3WC65_9ENTE|nr:metallopeptidase TldD-related protein [Enterococcus sp. 7F3_DIV0205]OTN86086.1 hypothetical protein A5821_002036 [Enterococcus sp. 7F3_DIV0205]
MFIQEVQEIEIKNMYGHYFIDRKHEKGSSEYINGILKAKTLNDFQLSFDEKIVENVIKIFDKCYDWTIFNSDNLILYYKKHHEIVNMDDKINERGYSFVRIVYKNRLHATLVEELEFDNDEFCLDKVMDGIRKLEKHLSYMLNQTKTRFSSTNSVILSPISSGYFVHEIIGHLLEDDLFYHKQSIINKSIQASKMLNVSDIVTENIDINDFDDEGNPCKDIVLIKNGEIINCMSKASGNRRRQNYKFPCTTRMRTTYVHPVIEKKVDQFISESDGDIYFDRIIFGHMNPLTGDYLVSGYGYKITDGLKTNFISDLTISGNIIEDLVKIQEIGNDLFKQGSECLKLSQVIRVNCLSPSMKLENINIMGEIYE